MHRAPFGLSTLMESLRHSEQKQKESEILFNAIIGESVVSDNIKDQLMGDGSIEDELELVDENDPELNKILDMIPEDDEEEELLDELDNIIESAIIADMNGNPEY